MLQLATRSVTIVEDNSVLLGQKVFSSDCGTSKCDAGVSVLSPAQFCAHKCHIYPPCTPPYLFVRDSFALGENYCMHRFSSIIHLCSQQPAFNTEIPQTLARNYHSTPSKRCIPARGGPDGVKKHEPRRHGFWATLKHERILITPHQASVRGSEIGNVKCLIFRRKHQ